MSQVFAVTSFSKQLLILCPLQTTDLSDALSVEAGTGTDTFTMNGHPTQMSPALYEGTAQAHNQLESLTADLEEESTRLQWLKEQVQLFEMSYDECNNLIHKTAENLICKIRNHEQRLLEEAAAHRETEYRKLGCSTEALNQKCQDVEVLQKQAQAALNNTILPDIYQVQGMAVKISQALQDNDSIGDNTNVMAKIYFCPVRCNTAFGTTDTVEPSGTPPRDISPRLSPTTLTASLATTRQHGGRSLSKALLGSSHEAGGGTKQRRCSLQVHHSPTQSPKNLSPSVSRNPLVEVTSPVVLLWEVNMEGSAPGQINCPNDVTFLDDDTVAVSDRDNQRIQLFNKQGKFLKVIGQGKIKPRRITRTLQGHIALTDSKDNCVKVFDTNGQMIATWGKKRFKSVFKAPCGIAINSCGQFIVSDMERHSVTIHQPDGKLVKYLGSNGQPIDFQSPSYVTVNAKDEILVSDNCSHTVKVFDKDGNYILHLSKFDSDDSHLKYPNGVCTDEVGSIFVADWGNHLVSQFEAKGSFSRHVVNRNDGLCHPAGIAVRSGCLALSEYSDTHSAIRLYRL